jgi:hypothetical protein
LRWRHIRGILLASLLTAAAVATGATPFELYPEGVLDYTALRGPAVYFSVAQACWGPGWAWFSFSGTATTNGNHRYFTRQMAIGGSTNLVTMRHEAWSPATNQVVLSFQLSAPLTAPLTSICATLQADSREFAGGRAYAILTNGTTNNFALPFSGIATIGNSVQQLILRTTGGTNTIFDIAPPRKISMDSQARIELASGSIPGGVTNTTVITVTLPREGALLRRRTGQLDPLQHQWMVPL